MTTQRFIFAKTDSPYSKVKYTSDHEWVGLLKEQNSESGSKPYKNWKIKFLFILTRKNLNNIFMKF